MSRQILEIIEPGLLTTIQDRGRYGYQRFGVPVSGAMDTFALRAANLLVGNDQGAAALEMTVLGPRIRFLDDTWFALAGADLSPTLDGVPVVSWQTISAKKDSVLSFQGAQDGMRSYLAVAGGFDVPLVMGSRSTYTKTAMGGFEGRPLKAGDVLSSLDVASDAEFVELKLPEHIQAPTYGHKHQVRVILGPQKEAFTSSGIDTFLNSEYTVTIQSDRMGYRLEGPVIEHVSGPDIVSDGIPLGAIQVPGDGRPIVLLTDRGTTGGYTKIATVISTDIGILAQALPGDTITFQAIAIEDAHAILHDQEAALLTLAWAAGVGPPPKLNITVDGEAFEVTDEQGEAITLSGPTTSDNNGWNHHAKATIDGRTYEFDVQIQQAE